MTTGRMGPVQPWWRIRMVWLAFGGPAVVVVASFITLFFAIHGRDVPLSERGAAEVATEIHHEAAKPALNHAVTPGR